MVCDVNSSNTVTSNGPLLSERIDNRSLFLSSPGLIPCILMPPVIRAAGRRQERRGSEVAAGKLVSTAGSYRWGAIQASCTGGGGGWLVGFGFTRATSISSRTTVSPILHPIALQESHQTERALIQKKSESKALSCESRHPGAGVMRFGPLRHELIHPGL